MVREEIEAKIKDLFDQNYEMLKLDGGHALTGDVVRAAYNQVLYYYKRLSTIAERVTETEVRLTLPEQKTPEGRTFTIEGVVDIVREENETWMYDIKTHEADYIRSNKEQYEQQLNIYAYIFEHLRNTKLDHTAVVSTSFPFNLKNAIIEGDPARINSEINKWDPIIDIPYEEKKVNETIHKFAQVVDKIESNCFEPKAVEELNKKMEGTNTLFATRVCRNCDARYSCEAYREYALKSASTSDYKQYFEPFVSESDQEEFLTSNIKLDKINTKPDLPE